MAPLKLKMRLGSGVFKLSGEVFFVFVFWLEKDGFKFAGFDRIVGKRGLWLKMIGLRSFSGPVGIGQLIFCDALAGRNKLGPK
jgi:hypothetical protein